MSGNITDFQSLRKSPLDHLDWFCDWGGSGWEGLVRQAIDECLGSDLAGQRVLELGPRQGRMSCLFALLGAEVIAVDLHDYWLQEAASTALSLGVDSKVRFIQNSGPLEDLPAREIDVVFTKSVLVVTPDLRATLGGLHSLLRPGGRAVFIENTRGGPIVRSLRWLKHRGRWDYSQAHYFSTLEVRLVEQFFAPQLLHSISFPPVILISGTRRDDPGGVHGEA
jgi:SAM-dependent methyltransferase